MVGGTHKEEAYRKALELGIKLIKEIYDKVFDKIDELEFKKCHFNFVLWNELLVKNYPEELKFRPFDKNFNYKNFCKKYVEQPFPADEKLRPEFVANKDYFCKQYRLKDAFYGALKASRAVFQASLLRTKQNQMREEKRSEKEFEEFYEIWGKRSGKYSRDYLFEDCAGLALIFNQLATENSAIIFLYPNMSTSDVSQGSIEGLKFALKKQGCIVSFVNFDVYSNPDKKKLINNNNNLKQEKNPGVSRQVSNQKKSSNNLDQIAVQTKRSSLENIRHRGQHFFSNQLEKFPKSNKECDQGKKTSASSLGFSLKNSW
jgi:hypothetical protein